MSMQAKKIGLAVDKLLPLKAFYLGQSIANHRNSPEAIKMIDKAVVLCGDSEDFQIRKVFYLLIKCEVNRDSNWRSSDRDIARKFCKEIHHDILYENYMKIVEITVSRTTVSDWSIVRPGRTHSGENSYHMFAEDESALRRHEPLFRALGLSIRDCSEQNHKFLYDTSLIFILDKHFGEKINN